MVKDFCVVDVAFDSNERTIESNHLSLIIFIFQTYICICHMPVSDQHMAFTCIEYILFSSSFPTHVYSEIAMSSEDAERISELQDRMKKIMNDPVVKELGDMLAYTPIWGMTGGALTYFLTDWAYKTNRIAPKSPRFVKFGIFQASNHLINS